MKITNEMLRSVRPLRRMIRRSKRKTQEILAQMNREGVSEELKTVLDNRKMQEEKAVVEYEQRLLEVETAISSVDDICIREILLYRYSDGFSWGQIAGRMAGCSPSTCRMMLKRWLDKNV